MGDDQDGLRVAAGSSDALCGLGLSAALVLFVVRRAHLDRVDR